MGANGSQVALQRSYEEELERDLRQLLDRALGPGKSAVQVSATLNFDRLETETETFSPGESADGVARSATTVTESYSTSGDATTGAVPGAVANIPGADTTIPVPAAGANAEEATTAYSRTETTSNFEVGRTVTRSTQAVGGVTRLSVSLLLDESVTEAQATSLLETVSAAAGIDADRGDTVAITRIPFDRTAIEEAETAFAAEASMAQILGYVRIGLPILVLAVAFFLFRLLMRSIGSRSTYRLTEAPQGALPPGTPGAAPVELPLGTAASAALPAPAAEMQSQVENQVTKLAENNPETVAGVVQSWLREE